MNGVRVVNAVMHGVRVVNAVDAVMNGVRVVNAVIVCLLRSTPGAPLCNY